MQSVLLVSDGQGSKHLKYLPNYVAFLPVLRFTLHCLLTGMVEHHSVWGNPGFLFQFGQLGLASGYLGTHARLFYGGRC